jgi:hypothetical protein
MPSWLLWTRWILVRIIFFDLLNSSQARQHPFLFFFPFGFVDPKVGRPGYVPYAFTADFENYLQSRDTAMKLPSVQASMDWSVRHANPKYTAPFTPQQYKTVFEGMREVGTPAFYVILQHTHKLLSDTAALSKLPADVDVKAWALYRRFRYRPSESSSAFGQEADASAKPVRRSFLLPIADSPLWLFRPIFLCHYWALCSALSQPVQQYHQYPEVFLLFCRRSLVSLSVPGSFVCV